MPNYVTPTKGAISANDTAGTHNLVPQIWAPEVEKNRTDNLVLWNFIDHSNLDPGTQQGDVVHVPFMSEIADDFTNNASVTAASAIEAVQTTLIDVFIDRYLRKAVGVQDVAKAQSKYEFRSLYVERLGRWLAKGMDTEVLNKIRASGSGIKKVQTAAAGVLAYADIVKALGELDGANVPEDNRALFVNGKTRALLRLIPEFTAYSSVGEGGIVKTKNGLVGHIFGMPVYVTNVIDQVGGKDVVYIMHKSALKGLAQMTKTEDGRDKLAGTDYVVGSSLFGCAVARKDHIVEITVK